MKSYSRRAHAFIWAIHLLGAATVAATFALPPLPGDRLPLYPTAFVLALAAAAGSRTVRLVRSARKSEKGTLSLGFFVTFAALVTLGLRACLLAAIVSGVSAGLFPRRVPWHQLAFNAASLAITAWLTGQTYAALNGGNVGTVHLAHTHAVLAALVYFAVNSSLVAGVIALCSPRSFREVWGSFLWTAPSYLAGAAAAMALFLLFGASAGQMLALPILIFLYQAYNAHITNEEQREHHLAELRRSEERFQRFMDHVPAAAWITDAEGRLVYRNQAYASLAGLADETAQNRSVFDLFPAEIAQRFQENSRRVLETGQILATEETIPRADGTPGQFLLYRFPVPDALGGTLVGGVAVDVTERCRLEEQLRQAQKMEGIGQLAGGVAHDFNNLLSAILGYTQIALMEAEPGSELEQNLGHVEQAAERAAGLTRQLLSFARRQRVEPKRVDLGALVSGLAPLLRRLISEDVELAVVLHDEALWVQTDPNQMEQVLVNLAVNARDAMPRGGRLTVEIRRATLSAPHRHVPPGEYILLAVSDTGVGMTEEVKAHLFEPFFTTKEVGKGTGLGLATVYGNVKQSGGYISVESEVGIGTAFTIYLPPAAVEEGETGPPPEETPLPHGTESILVVEDEPLLRRLAAQTLQSLGYTVIEAQNGGEALSLPFETVCKIDLLLTDVVMPQVGGQELAERLRAINPALQVLFVSGYTGHPLERIESSPFPGSLLEKPFTLAVLARKVREVLDSRSPESSPSALTSVCLVADVRLAQQKDSPPASPA